MTKLSRLDLALQVRSARYIATDRSGRDDCLRVAIWEFIQAAEAYLQANQARKRVERAG